jgi:excisionase family DNA binding protein
VTDARKPVRRAYMSISEVAEYFAIDARTVRRMISNRLISANQIGRQWRIPISEIEALEKRTSTKRWG